MKNLLGVALGNEGSLVINRRLAEMFDCKDAALVLQYLIARQNITGPEFTCNAKKLEIHCIIGEHKRRSIFKKLKKESILEIVRKGAPAQNFFSIKIKNLETRYLESEDQESRIPETTAIIEGDVKSSVEIKNLETRNQESVYIYNKEVIHKKEFLGKSSFCNEKKKDNEFLEKNSSHALKEKSPLGLNDECFNFVQSLKENPSKLNKKGGNLTIQTKIQPEIRGKGKSLKKQQLKAEMIIFSSEVISYLNAMANKKYKPESPETLKVISKKVQEGFQILDFKSVIDIKTSEWKSSREMNRYLRPATLFGPKFESYLNSAPIKKEDPVKKAFLDQI